MNPRSIVNPQSIIHTLKNLRDMTVTYNQLEMYVSALCSRQLKQLKSPSCFEVIPCNNEDIFLLQDYEILRFLRLEFIKELFLFPRVEFYFKYKQGIFIFLQYIKY